jgi:hypothetical protein
MTALLPLYVHPLADPEAWALAAGLAGHALVVVNVHNGPGQVPDPAYREATARLRAGWVPMLGYVDLDYGRRPGGAIRADLAGWGRYPVTGIFFDQAPGDQAGLGWTARQAGLARQAYPPPGRSPGHSVPSWPDQRPRPGRRPLPTVVLNPGVVPAPGYAALADLICTYEGPWDGYRDRPGTTRDCPNAAHLVYGVPVDELPAATALLRSRTRYGLVSELGPPLPYLGLPYLGLPVDPRAPR